MLSQGHFTQLSCSYTWGSLNRLQGHWLAFKCQQMLKYSPIWNIFKKDKDQPQVTWWLMAWNMWTIHRSDQTRPFPRSSRAIPHIPRKVEARLLRRAHLPAAICCLCVLKANLVHGLWALLWFWALDHFKNQGKSNKHVGYKKLFRYLGCLLVKSIKIQIIPDLGCSWRGFLKALCWKRVLTEAVMPNSHAYKLLHAKLNGLLRDDGCIREKIILALPNSSWVT